MLIFNMAVSQTNLTIAGKTYNNTDDTWEGVNIPRSSPTKLVFKNNKITSRNRFGYMLQAGDEGRASTNNNLDGAIITGNQLIWNGSNMDVIPHGIFTGHNRNVVVKYNYLNHVPMGIIRKSATNMTNTGGGVAYNIVKGGVVGMVIKGMSGVNIFNNTFYQDRTSSQTWRPLVHIYTNTDGTLYSVAHNTRIYNNIFYTKYKVPMITLDDQESLTGLECDYNLYWSEAGKPVFSVNGNELTFEQWQQLGYDRHSVVMDPGFKDFVNFVPGRRLDYGTDLGNEWTDGLSVNATWSASDPATASQNGKWQVGARVYSDNQKPDASGNAVLIQSVVNNNAPSVIEMTFSAGLADIVPSTGAFTINVNSGIVVAERISISGKKVLVNTATSINSEDAVSITYKKPGLNPLQTTSGYEIPDINDHLVVNNILSSLTSLIKVFPNPAKGFFNLSNFSPDKLPQVIRIYDLSGKLRYEKIFDQEILYKVPVSLRPGIYILYLKLGSDIEQKQRLLVIE